MRSGNQGLRDIARLTLTLMTLAAPGSPARAQATVTKENMVEQLAGLETSPELDIPALRQQALERIKSRADSTPLKRPPVAAELLTLPQFSVDILFDTDSPIVRSESYQMLGRIADVLSDPKLLPYSFLIVGHTDTGGKREANLTLSQRRADALRDVLATTFRISPKRLQAVGLGEEQLGDAEHPTSAINKQTQIVTVGKLAPAAGVPVATPASSARPRISKRTTPQAR
jgi:OOP family OmpA-OmpF porin